MKSLFFLAQPLLDAFARLGREGLGREAVFVFLVPPRGGTQEADLISIAPTPPAEPQMNAQAKALTQAEWTIQRLGLQSRGLATIGRKLHGLVEESLQHVHQPIHCCPGVTIT